MQPQKQQNQHSDKSQSTRHDDPQSTRASSAQEQQQVGQQKQPSAQGNHQQGQKPGDAQSKQQQAVQPAQQQQRDATSTSGNRSPVAGQDGKNQVQGEGDYVSNRRYTESVKEFVESGKVDAAARNAKPQSQQEAAEMRKAEQAGASHAKGSPSPDRKRSQQP